MSMMRIHSVRPNNIHGGINLVYPENFIHISNYAEAYNRPFYFYFLFSYVGFVPLGDLLDVWRYLKFRFGRQKWPVSY